MHVPPSWDPTPVFRQHYQNVHREPQNERPSHPDTSLLSFRLPDLSFEVLPPESPVDPSYEMVQRIWWDNVLRFPVARDHQDDMLLVAVIRCQMSILDNTPKLGKGREKTVVPCQLIASTSTIPSVLAIMSPRCLTLQESRFDLQMSYAPQGCSDISYRNTWDAVIVHRPQVLEGWSVQAETQRLHLIIPPDHNG